MTRTYSFHVSLGYTGCSVTDKVEVEIPEGSNPPKIQSSRSGSHTSPVSTLFVNFKLTNQMKSIVVDGVTYAPVDSLATPLEGMAFVMVRTYSAGVFVGYISKREGKEVVLKQARRIWSWQGAASLSQLAQSGTSAPDQCKFPEAVTEVILTEAIEILSVTEKAKTIIDSVPVWKQ